MPQAGSDVMLTFLAALAVAAAPTPTVVPGHGMAGVSLGMTRAQIERRLGPGQTPTVVVAHQSCLTWEWERPATLPAELITCFDVRTWRAVAFSSATIGWRIPGTRFRLQTDQNIRALKAAYGARLRGPYTKSSGNFFDSDLVYYELLGTYEGRRVHTTFEVDVDEPDRHMIVGAHVGWCSPREVDYVACGKR
jgi:hypothetical protein